MSVTPSQDTPAGVGCNFCHPGKRGDIRRIYPTAADVPFITPPVDSSKLCLKLDAPWDQTCSVESGSCSRRDNGHKFSYLCCGEDEETTPVYGRSCTGGECRRKKPCGCKGPCRRSSSSRSGSSSPVYRTGAVVPASTMSN